MSTILAMRSACSTFHVPRPTPQRSKYRQFKYQGYAAGGAEMPGFIATPGPLFGVQNSALRRSEMECELPML